MKKPSILIVDDEHLQLKELCVRASEAGFQEVKDCLRIKEAKDAWTDHGGFDAVLLDLKMDGDENGGYNLLKWMREHSVLPERVFIRSAFLKGKIPSQEAVALQKITFYEKDTDEHEEKLNEHLEEFVTQQEGKWDKKIVYQSPTDQQIKGQICHLATSDLAVLIIGPTGSGKSVLARQIAEAAKCEPIIEVNCPAISSELFESIVFGHKKGSFTNAFHDHLGHLMVASGYLSFTGNSKSPYKNGHAFKSPSKKQGAIILDEVAVLSVENQAKLLTVLDGAPIMPVGHQGDGFLPNFRVLAVTNEETTLGIKSRFREDLRQRLHGWVIRLAPANQRQDTAKEIIDKTQVFFRDEDGGKVVANIKMSLAAKDELIKSLHRVHGGFRELNHVIERAFLYAKMDGKKEVSPTYIEKAMNQSFQISSVPESIKSTSNEPVTSNNITSSLATADMQESAKSKLEKWLTERNIDAKKLNYHELLTVIPVDKYRDFLNFMTKEFSGRKKASQCQGFLAAVCAEQEQVPVATVRSAFTRVIKANGKK